MSTCLYPNSKHLQGVTRESCFLCKLEMSRVEGQHDEPKPAYSETEYYLGRYDKVCDKINLSTVHI